ncbi:unnamed protein product, partial [Iphiclides podalirius]
MFDFHTVLTKPTVGFCRGVCNCFTTIADIGGATRAAPPDGRERLARRMRIQRRVASAKAALGRTSTLGDFHKAGISIY